MADLPININASSKENVSNKSTDVVADQASNSKYPSVKALWDWAVGRFFDKPTGTTSQYLRGDGSLATFPTIPDVSGLQSKPVVVNGNITAQNDRVYHVVANATFTDPTPVEGRGYFVVVRFASSCVLGGNSYIAGETIHRIFHSGSWLNIALRPSTYVPISRTINGLDLTTNRTLTTANINDSANRRYVTDAQSTVIGNTSGTNTGDQTFITPRVQTVTSSATVTPTSTNDVVTITAQAEGLTLANPTGTFLEGQSLIIRIKDNGTARTIGYGSNYRAIGVTLPTTTVANKTTYIGCIWNSTDSKLDIIGVCTEV